VTHAALTMTGFEWFPRTIPAHRVPGSDGWCVRDAYCQLLTWPHLGVAVFDVGIPEYWNELVGKLDHPGIAMFEIPSIAAGHAVYVHHVRALLHHWPNFGAFPGGICQPSAGPSGPSTSGMGRGCSGSSWTSGSISGQCVTPAPSRHRPTWRSACAAGGLSGNHRRPRLARIGKGTGQPVEVCQVVMPRPRTA